MTTSPTIHASAVLFGCHGVLIRGPSGCGKSRLAWLLLRAASEGTQGFARLIGDDRVHIDPAHGRLLIRPARALEGRIEIRGLGIVRLAFEPVATAHLVVDLGESDAPRLPDKAQAETTIAGIRLARLAVAPGSDPFPPVRGWLEARNTTGRPGSGAQVTMNCNAPLS